MANVEPVKIPPHVFNQLVNQLRDTANTYANAQQLRAQLARTLSGYVQPDHPIEPRK